MTQPALVALLVLHRLQVSPRRKSLPRSLASMARTTALLVLFAQALPSNAWSNLRPSRALSPSSTVRMAQADVGRRETLTTGLAGIGALFVSSSFAPPALALPILTAKYVTKRDSGVISVRPAT